MAKEQIVLSDGNAREFNWKARNEDGKMISGTATAASTGDVAAELMGRNLAPESVNATTGGMALTKEMSFRKTSKPRSLVVATRQIATMLDSGLTYLQALEVVLDECDDLILADGLAAVKEDIRQGGLFADSMAKYPKAFPPVMINLIRAGEASGQVKDAMNQVADSLEAEDELRAKIKKAMMYPLVVLVLSTIIFMFLMLYLVPTFAVMYDELSFGEAKLPKLTMMVVGVSNFMKSPGMAVLAVSLVGSLLWYRSHKLDQNVRERVDPIKIKMPVFGNLFHKIALARFCRNLSGLLAAGVDTLEALEITSKTVGNVKIERATLEALEAHKQGKLLVEPLRAEPLFPGMLITMVQVGEESGRLAYMLGKAADIYDRDIDAITDNMSALIEPLFMMLLAGMVGTTAIAIYLPYISIGDIMGE
jgi:type IV pilus assembly protein PilC